MKKPDFEIVYNCYKCSKKESKRLTKPCVLRIPRGWDSGTTLPSICIFGCGDKTHKAEWEYVKKVDHKEGWVRS